MKFKLQGKTYTIVKDLPVLDTSLVKNIWLVVNSKKEEFKLVKSIKWYSLYDMSDRRITSTYSITFKN